MRWTVVWMPKAEADLAELWIESEDREALTFAIDLIDELLSQDPLKQGDSREGQERWLIMRPVTIQYTVSPDDRLVTVLTIWPVRIPF